MLEQQRLHLCHKPEILLLCLQLSIYGKVILALLLEDDEVSDYLLDGLFLAHHPLYNIVFRVLLLGGDAILHVVQVLQLFLEVVLNDKFGVCFKVLHFVPQLCVFWARLQLRRLPCNLVHRSLSLQVLHVLDRDFLGPLNVLREDPG